MRLYNPPSVTHLLYRDPFSSGNTAADTEIQEQVEGHWAFCSASWIALRGAAEVLCCAVLQSPRKHRSADCTAQQHGSMRDWETESRTAAVAHCAGPDHSLRCCSVCLTHLTCIRECHRQDSETV